jgi:hypothetical protein
MRRRSKKTPYCPATVGHKPTNTVGTASEKSDDLQVHRPLGLRPRITGKRLESIGSSICYFNRRGYLYTKSYTGLLRRLLQSILRIDSKSLWVYLTHVKPHYEFARRNLDKLHIKSTRLIWEIDLKCKLLWKGFHFTIPQDYYYEQSRADGSPNSELARSGSGLLRNTIIGRPKSRFCVPRA